MAKQTKKQVDSISTSVKDKMSKLKALDKEQLKKTGSLGEQRSKLDSFKKFGDTKGGLDYIQKTKKTTDSLHKERQKVLGVTPIKKVTNYTSSPKSPLVPSPLKKKKK